MAKNSRQRAFAGFEDDAASSLPDRITTDPAANPAD